MRFPSLDHVVSSAILTVRRFPLVLASAAVAVIAALVLVDHPGYIETWLRLLFAGILGIPFLTALALFIERRQMEGMGRRAFQLAAGLFLLAFFFAAGQWTETLQVRRFFHLVLGMHLLAAFLPLMRSEPRESFWRYNYHLFEQFLVSTIFAAVLFFGLALALLAVDKLFGLSIDGANYGRLFILAGLLFHPWHFLGNFPRDFARFQVELDYPPGLKIFSQYILVPLVAVYLVILTTYLGRVLITRIWPSGWIGYLVSSVAIVGLLAILLLDPVRERSENRWLKAFSRGYFIALLPAIGMLALAIWKRIDQYGITENRYLLSMWAVWLFAITLYFLFSRAKSIRAIPISLCIVTFAVAIGPWGAYAVSERSQISRLSQLFERNDMWVDGRAQAAPRKVSFDDRREMSGILEYLVDTHGTKGVAHWFEGELANVDPGTKGEWKRSSSRDRAVEILKRLGVDFVDGWRRGAQDASEFFNVFADPGMIDIAEFDRAFRVREHLPLGPEARAFLGGESADLSAVPPFTSLYDMKDRTIVLVDEQGRSLVEMSLGDAVEQALAANRTVGAGQSLPADSLRIETTNERGRIVFYIEHLTGVRQADGIRLHNLQGTVLIDDRE